MTVRQGLNVLVGKPVVKGTRILVELALAKLAANPDIQDLFQDYPRLTVDDVRACLAISLPSRRKPPWIDLRSSVASRGQTYMAIHIVPSLHR